MTGEYPIWTSGEFVPADKPVVLATDTGFTLGMAVFDSLVCSRGCLLFVERHLARFEAGALEMRLPWPPRVPDEATLTSILEEYVAEMIRLEPARAESEFIVRTTYTRGAPGAEPLLLLAGRDVIAPPSEGVVVALARGTKPAEPDLVESVKSTSRIRNVLAREDAQAEGAWEALLCSTAGDVIEGTICNVFVVLEGQLITPPVERGCLPGITRELLIEELGLSGEGAVREERIEIDQLQSAEEIFLTNSSGRLIPVREVLGLQDPFPGARGPRWQALRERFDRLEARYRAHRT